MDVPQILQSPQGVGPDAVSGRDPYVPAANPSGQAGQTFQQPGATWAQYDNQSANGSPTSNNASFRLTQMQGNNQIAPNAPGQDSLSQGLLGALAVGAVLAPGAFNYLNNPSSSSNATSSAQGGNATSSSQSTAAPQTSQSQTTTNNAGNNVLPPEDFTQSPESWYVPGSTNYGPGSGAPLNGTSGGGGFIPQDQGNLPQDNPGPIQGPLGPTAFNTPYDQFGLTGGGTQTASPSPAQGQTGGNPYTDPVPPPPMDEINAAYKFMQSGSLMSPQNVYGGINTYNPDGTINVGVPSNAAPVDEGALDSALNGGG